MTTGETSSESAKSRTPLSKKTRFEIFKRDGFACLYCGAHPPGVLLHVDHRLAVSKGGGNEFDNLVTACAACNLGKGARALEIVPQSLADKALVIAEQEMQLRGYQAVLEERRDRLESEAWRVVAVLDPGADSFRRVWLTSIRRFIEMLGVHSVIDAAERAAQRCIRSQQDQFRYFCGICWSMAREARDRNAVVDHDNSERC